MRFIFSLLHCLHELDRQMQPSWRVCHDRRLKNQLPAMCWWFDSASTESGFQCTLDRFAATYDTAGTKISSVKTDLLHVSRNTIISACSNWMERHRNKYLGVAFTSDVKQNKKLGIPTGNAIAIMKALHYSVVMRRFSACKTKIVKNEAKISFFETIFVPFYLLYLCMVMKIR